jgi:HTH-type transcriptional regulator, sugar sensing transcriptional regulator
MNKSSIAEALTYPGLSDKEVSVYLASLEIKKPTPQLVAKQTGMPRPSVYRILEELVEKGLMGKVEEGKRFMYVPEDPHVIVARLKLKAESVQSIMPELKNLAAIYQNRPTMRFFEGEEGMKRVCDDVLLTGEELLAFSSIEEIFEALPDYWPNFIKRRVQKKLFARIISPKGHKGMELKPLEKQEYRKIRFISESLAKKIGVIQGHVFIYKDKIAFLSFDSDKTSVIIENAALAKVQKSLFEIAWEAAKE